MKHFDLRSYSTEKQIEVYAKNGKSLYFSERKSSECGETLFLFALDTSTGKDDLLFYIALGNNHSYAHITYDAGVFTILAELSPDELWSVNVDAVKGDELSRTRISNIGHTVACRYLDSDTILLYAEESGAFSDVFAGYHRLTGRTRLSYLYDMKSGNRYYIRDNRISDGTPERVFSTTDSDGEEYVLINKERREAIYQATPPQGVRINRNKGRSKEDLRFLKKSKFIRSIMENDDTLRLDLICTSPNWEGACRVLRVSAGTVYYYLKNNVSGLVQVCGYNLKNGEKTLLDEHIAEPGNEDITFLVNPSDGRILRITPGSVNNRVTALTGNSASVSYPRWLGNIVGLLEDQHVVLEKIDELSTAPYYSLYHAKSEDVDGYSGRIRLIEDILLVY